MESFKVVKFLQQQISINPILKQVFEDDQIIC